MRMILLLVVALAGCDGLERNCIEGRIYYRSEGMWKLEYDAPKCKRLEEAK